MALSYVRQFVQARNSGTSLQQDTAIQVSAGDLVVVCASTWFTNGTPGTWTVTDDASQSYGEVVDTVGSGAQGLVGIFYKENHPGGNIKVTIDPNGTSSDIDFTVSVVSGAVTSGSLDKAVSDVDYSANNISSGTLAQADEILFAICTHQTGTQTLTPDTAGGWTQIGENEDNSSGQCYNAQYKIVASTTSEVADWTGPFGVLEMCLASFKEGAAVATYIPNPFVRSDVMKALINL